MSVVEKVAYQIWNQGSHNVQPWDYMNKEGKAIYLNQAKAALTALADASLDEMALEAALGNLLTSKINPSVAMAEARAAIRAYLTSIKESL